METMTRQQVFDKVYRHLLKQGEKAMDEQGEECVYRADNGCMCAIGCLILDEHYDPSFEGAGIPSRPLYEGVLANKHISPKKNNIAKLVTALKASGVPLETTEDFAFLSELQTVHDEHNVEGWKEVLGLKARNNDLTVPERSTS